MKKILDYSVSDNCTNENAFGCICVKCGKCGRKFDGGGMLIEESEKDGL